MPKRHGLKWLKNDLSAQVYPTCQLGILEVLDALKRGPFRSTFRSRNPTGNDPATSLWQHGDKIARRLVYSLEQLQTSLTGYAGSVGTDAITENLNHHMAAEVAVDSTAHYLGVLIDDVARAIPFVIDETCDKLADGFSDVKLEVKTGKYPTMTTLFDELANPGSWWELALKRGQGIRQRITHYTDLVFVQASHVEREARWVPQVYVWDALDLRIRLDYVSTLRQLLHHLCDWLDRLEAELVKELDQRAARQSLKWTRLTYTPNVQLPMKLHGGVEIPDQDYLYLPLCEGSLAPN